MAHAAAHIKKARSEMDQPPDLKALEKARERRRRSRERAERKRKVLIIGTLPSGKSSISPQCDQETSHLIALTITPSPCHHHEVCYQELGREFWKQTSSSSSSDHPFLLNVTKMVTSPHFQSSLHLLFIIEASRHPHQTLSDSLRHRAAPL